MDTKTREEIWRFKTSSDTRWSIPPKSEWFELEVEVPKEEAEDLKDKYGHSLNFFESDEVKEDVYSVKSEYVTKSEYV